ncbi:flagellar protein FlaG [Paraferrimonas sedimenticola]|uniref:Flagella locus protein FlaG n=1 Tax=Paraferrimonas sedimenticola TaxID=375674 RepID=A0AA37RU43_9GAMM|nr:flagellar protein FlaG [Paraferrimonas sedimenticola]GLP94982.1 flagella locus protein FlaG [Paraferrimonas sedimenticola]
MEINQAAAASSNASLLTKPNLEAQAAQAKQQELPEQASVSSVEANQAKSGAESREQVDLEQIVHEMAEFVEMIQKGLSFGIHEASGKQTIAVIDTDTGEVIRHIPSIEALELAQKLADAQGLLLNDEA